MKKIKLLCNIETPIHIWSGQEYNRTQFYMSEGMICVLDESWMQGLHASDPSLFDSMLDAIKNKNMKKFVELQNRYDLSQYCQKRLQCSDSAHDSLSNIGGKNNQGIIKKFPQNFDTYYIPGSTIKGMILSVFFYWYVSTKKINFDMIKNDEKGQSHIIEQGKKISQSIMVHDILLSGEVDISVEQAVSQNAKQYSGDIKAKPTGIPLIAEMLKSGTFNIDIVILPHDKSTLLESFIENFDKALHMYCEHINRAERRVMENVAGTYTIDDYLKIKIGMYKKSYTYKMYRDELLESVYSKHNHKTGMRDMDTDKASIIGVGDKSIALLDNKGLGRVKIEDILFH